MNKKSRFFAAAAYILCVACIFTGLGCSARASLSVAQDKSAILTFKTATGKTLDGTIRSITGAEQNALLFDEQAIRNAFSQASFFPCHFFEYLSPLVITSKTLSLGFNERAGS